MKGNFKMSMTNEEKQELIAKYGSNPNDTGSPEVQIAIWTYRINSLIEHFNVHKNGQPPPSPFGPLKGQK
jgi:ribosomal protein S15